MPAGNDAPLATIQLNLPPTRRERPLLCYILAPLVALDAKTGQVAWSAKNGDPSKGGTGTSAPLVVKDKVLVGISGGEFGVQCHVTAYDLKTGKQVWRAFSEGPDDQIMSTAEGRAPSFAGRASDPLFIPQIAACVRF